MSNEWQEYIEVLGEAGAKVAILDWRDEDDKQIQKNN